MSSTEVEPVEIFAQRARQWIQANLPRVSSRDQLATMYSRHSSDDEELERLARCREIQRALFDAGFAGLCVPREYGGQGLTTAHQAAFNIEIDGYDYPAEIQIPTFVPCLPVILEFGTEAQKLEHIPAILKGEEAWVQLLSEPGGGSDAAGAITRADRVEGGWLLNGSKIWTTGAWWADWGLCLARTDWDKPKHAGLTVFMVPLRQTGIQINRIEMLNGSKEFCEEFITDVFVPDSDRVGETDSGWGVGTRWMHHERTARGGSPYVTRPGGRTPSRGPAGGARALLSQIQAADRPFDDRTRELVGEVETLELVGSALGSHLGARIRSNQGNPASASVIRLFSGVAAARSNSIAFELMGAAGIAWSGDSPEDGQSGVGYLMRQAACIGGGTSEMSRNIISERLLGMPREQTLDRNVPFRDVPRGDAG